jgi:2-dehydropantoate 2-reductase
MRFVLIGAGAIGAGVGGLLAEQRQDVVLVARGAHLRAMRENGLRLLLPDRQVQVSPPVAGSPDDVTLRPDDVLVLTTKTHQAPDALAAWSAAPVRDEGGERVGTAGELLPVLTALNGVASEEMALRWFARVVGICVWMPAVLTAPGEVVVRSSPTRAILHASRYPASLADDDDTRLLGAVASAWARAGIEVPLPEDVMPWKYRKLLGNLGNAVQALVGSQAGDADDVAEAARVEARALYEAAGIAVNSAESEEVWRDRLTVRPVPGAPQELGGSTWQSLQRGTGSAETDYLNGEIAAIAHRLGRRAPVNTALTELMRDAVEHGRRPGDLSADELRRRVLP